MVTKTGRDPMIVTGTVGLMTTVRMTAVTIRMIAATTTQTAVTIPIAAAMTRTTAPMIDPSWQSICP
jgi:hypothetical protein